MTFAAFNKADGETGQLTRFNFKETIIEAATEKNKDLTGRTVAEVAAAQGKHPVDVMLDLAVEENLQTEFRMSGRINNDEEALAKILKHTRIGRTRSWIKRGGYSFARLSARLRQLFSPYRITGDVSPLPG